MKISSEDTEAEVKLSVDKHTKSSGWGTTFPKRTVTTCQRSHELLVSSRLRVPPLLRVFCSAQEWRNHTLVDHEQLDV